MTYYKVDIFTLLELLEPALLIAFLRITFCFLEAFKIPRNKQNIYTIFGYLTVRGIFGTILNYLQQVKSRIPDPLFLSFLTMLVQ
jgi:hypothetical protein